jgi:DNA/RNA-binding domain of Phe-tRNA-synthetase-like protein
VDAALFALVPHFARATVALDLAAGVAPAPALAAYARRVAERAARAEAGRSPEAHSPKVEPAALPAGAPGRLAHGWRDAYRAVGIPDDIVPPHEALAIWARARGALPSQGSVLDLVNAFSLAAATPCAAYDVSGARGGLWLRPARGHETHEALDGTWTSPSIAEFVLADGEDRLLALHWHGSPGRAFVPDSGSRRVLAHIDVLDEAPETGAARLGAEFGRLAGAMLGATARVQVLCAATPIVRWTA